MTCKTSGCNDEAKILGLCKKCYSYMYYYRQKTQKDIVDRMQQIIIWESRLDLLMPHSVTVKRFKRTISPLEEIPGLAVKNRKQKNKPEFPKPKKQLIPRQRRYANR